MQNRHYKVVISKQTFEKVKDYKKFLAENGFDAAGELFQRMYTQFMSSKKKTDCKENFKSYLQSLSVDEILHILNLTRVPEDAESTTRWNNQEASILSDVNFVIEGVTAYNNGGSGDVRENHLQHVPVTILYSPGPMLSWDTTTADMEEILEESNTKINETKYTSFVERHLLPLFIFANEAAAKKNKKALITLEIPGLKFAGNFKEEVEYKFFPNALKKILINNSNNSNLYKNIYVVRVNAPGYDSTIISDSSIHTRRILFRPQNGTLQLLHNPETYDEEGFADCKDCELFTIVDGCPFSYLGNQFLVDNANMEISNEEKIFSATNALTRFYGIPGTYFNGPMCYHPSVRRGKTWYEAIKFSDPQPMVDSLERTFVVDDSGNKFKLNGNDLIPVENSSTAKIAQPSHSIKIKDDKSSDDDEVELLISIIQASDECQANNSWWNRNKYKLLFGVLLGTAIIIGAASIVADVTGVGAVVGVPGHWLSAFLGFKAASMASYSAVAGVSVAPAFLVTVMGAVVKWKDNIKNFFSFNNASDSRSKKQDSKTSLSSSDDSDNDDKINKNTLDPSTNTMINQFLATSDNKLNASSPKHNTQPSKLKNEVSKTSENQQIKNTILNIVNYDQAKGFVKFGFSKKPSIIIEFDSQPSIALLSQLDQAEFTLSQFIRNSNFYLQVDGKNSTDPDAPVFNDEDLTKLKTLLANHNINDHEQISVMLEEANQRKPQPKSGYRP